MDELDVEAILFDVFGTVVDWRSGVIRVGESLDSACAQDVDWGAFAEAWRDEYGPSLAQVREGELDWRNLDTLQRDSLAELLERFDLTALPPRERERLLASWHCLDPWPDSIPGLRRLKPHYVIAPLSNGHVRLLTNMAKRAGIPWDLILSAELAQAYKPDAAVYRTAVDLLDVPADDVMMVAAHEGDLEASAAVGLRTAFVHRPFEWGPVGDSAAKPPASAYDLVVDELCELADRLDAPPITP